MLITKIFLAGASDTTIIIYLLKIIINADLSNIVVVAMAVNDKVAVCNKQHCTHTSTYQVPLYDNRETYIRTFELPTLPFCRVNPS